ncbi:MAG: class 1 fructose-bisphosphatase [Acidobacteriota bacterium]
MSEPLGTTLGRFIRRQERRHVQARGELSGLLEAIGFAGRQIAAAVRKAGLNDIIGHAGSVNVQGETVQKLDLLANEILIQSLDHVGHCCILASEEMDDGLPVDEQPGDYAVAFDPLDGSGNIDTNMPMGTIYSIYRRTSEPGAPGQEFDFLRPGREQVAAGYILYGSSSMLVHATEDGVAGFTLDPEIGAWLLSHPDIKIPERGKQYLVNTGNRAYWHPHLREHVAALESVDPERGRPLGQRYVGALIADVHRILLKGGVFMYPADTKDPKKPNGKLRLLYECAPMAMIVERAGGAATDGRGPILDLDIKELHQRTPLFIGSRLDVEEATAAASQDG